MRVNACDNLVVETERASPRTLRNVHLMHHNGCLPWPRYVRVCGMNRGSRIDYVLKPDFSVLALGEVATSKKSEMPTSRQKTKCAQKKIDHQICCRMVSKSQLMSQVLL